MLDRSTGLLRCPTLIARSDQQHTLDVALDRLAAGHGSGVVVVGEAGVGKSRLVEWLRDSCADRGVPMLIGRASDAGTPTALAPIQEALVGCTGLLAADLAGRIGVRDQLAENAGLFDENHVELAAFDTTAKLVGRFAG